MTNCVHEKSTTSPSSVTVGLDEIDDNFSFETPKPSARKLLLSPPKPSVPLKLKRRLTLHPTQFQSCPDDDLSSTISSKLILPTLPDSLADALMCSRNVKRQKLSRDCSFRKGLQWKVFQLQPRNISREEDYKETETCYTPQIPFVLRRRASPDDSSLVSN